MKLKKPNKLASSRRQIDIKGIEDGVLILPDSRYRVVLKTTSVNFELMSEEEQDALIETYQTFLNSLSFPVQIIVRVREVDIDEYLAQWKEKLATENSKIYRQQIAGYDKFIRELIATNQILSRQFYIAIPFTPNKKMSFDLIKEQLALQVNIVSKGLGKLGLKTEQLNNIDLLNVFHAAYNLSGNSVKQLTEENLIAAEKSYIKGLR